MLIKDTPLQERHQILDPIVKHQAQVAKMLDDELRNCVYTEDMEWNPANPTQQLGQPMTHQQLEVRLAPHIPSGFVFDDDLTATNKRALYRVTPEGRERVLRFERGLMPEHSIMRVKVDWVRDPAQKHLEAADHKAAHVTVGGLEWEPGAQRPGWIKVTKLWGEIVRGWRTVLIRLVQEGVIPISVAESFGGDDRPTWAAGLGKRQLTLPY